MKTLINIICVVSMIMLLGGCTKPPAVKVTKYETVEVKVPTKIKIPRPTKCDNFEGDGLIPITGLLECIREQKKLLEMFGTFQD